MSETTHTLCTQQHDVADDDDDDDDDDHVPDDDFAYIANIFLQVMEFSKPFKYQGITILQKRVNTFYIYIYIFILIISSSSKS